MWPPSRSSVVTAFAAMAIGAGVFLGLGGWPQPHQTLEFSGLILAALLISALRTQQSTARDWATMPPSFVIDFTGLLLLGPHATTIVATVGAMMQGLTDSQRRHRFRRVIFNAITVVAAAQAAGLVHRVFGGSIGTFSWPGQGLPIALAVIAYCFVKSASAEIIVPFLTKQPASRSWPISLLGGAPSYFIGASLAVGFVAIVDHRMWDVLPVAAVPLYFAYRAYCAHVIRLDEEHRQRDVIETLEQARARAEHALKRSEERLALAAEGANDGLWEWDLHNKEFYCSSRWRAMLGLPAPAGIGPVTEWFDRVHEDDRRNLKATLEAHLSGKSDYFQLAHRIRHADGSYRQFLCRGVAERGAGDGLHRIAGSLTDAAERALATGRAQSAGFLDPLTGLSNRAFFVERLGRRLEEFKQRRSASPFAALYLDLDRFKVVNDSLGHLVGDELLTLVSRRLESCLREGDALARLGGDEFAILLNGLSGANQANAIAFRIQQVLSAPCSIGGRQVFTSVSIGIACGHAHYNNPDEMMRDADTAMYHAKSRGKARHEMFDADMHARELDRLGLENDLRHAVNTNDFEVHYQPIVLLSSGMCVGFESLARWTRNGKAVSPVTFIQLAEELGIIEPLGTWVLQQACSTFADWKRRFPDAGLDFVTVNLSSRQLMQQNFLWMVEQAVQKAGLKPCDLRLEITETALMDSPNEAAKLLRELRAFGTKIYLDDFGCGYSSLSHLAKLPVDALKIDRSFVKSLLLPDRPAIVESIMALARTLNMSVVAEGIEQDAQGRELERLGCTHAQGFLFSRPVSTIAAEEIIAANVPLGPKKAQPSHVIASKGYKSEFDYSPTTFQWPEELLTRSQVIGQAFDSD